MAHSLTAWPFAARLGLALMLLASLFAAPFVPAISPGTHAQTQHHVDFDHGCRHEPANRCCSTHCMMALPPLAPLPLELALTQAVGPALKTRLDGAGVPRIERPPKA
jgi:hypothetical protein